MLFLNDSWTNIAENDEAEARLLTTLENETYVQANDNDGFQIQVSKSQKKSIEEAEESFKGYICNWIKG